MQKLLVATSQANSNAHAASAAPHLPPPIVSDHALRFDATRDDPLTLLSSDQRRYYRNYALPLLRSKLREVFHDMYDKERSSVAPQLALHRQSLYTSLRIVHAPFGAGMYRGAAADSFEGASMESTNVLSLLESQRSRSLLIEGRAGIGKSTWGMHLAQLQNFDEGVVILLKLSELAVYLEGKHLKYSMGTVSPSSASISLSARELLFVALGQNNSLLDFIDLIYFHFRLLCETTSTSAKRITWVIDGLDEVVSRNDALLGVVIDALEKITQSSNIEAPISRADHRIELFGSHDIIVITSREERGGALAGAQLVATINPWTTTEALEYVGNYFKQRAVRDVILAGSCSTQSSLNSNASELVALCMKRATSAIHEHRFGSFSTLPIVLEILCWSALEEDGRMGCIADLYHDTFVKTIAAARENSSSSPLSSPTTTPAWTSSDEEIFTLHNEKAVEATQDGVFFTINRTHPCGRDLFRSGLVRERIGAKHDRTIVRFAHKSFLEYFQAAFFAEHLDQLQTKLAHVDVATPSGSDEESSVSFLACTVRDDFTMIKNNSHQMDVIVDMTLYCAWEPAIVCEILWLEGAGEKAASDATKDKTFGRYRPPSRAGSVGGEWRTSVKLKFRSVTKTYYLVVRPTSGECIYPFQCTLKSTTSGSLAQLFTITQVLPLIIIPE